MANSSIGEVSGGLSGLGAVNKMKAAADRAKANQLTTVARRPPAKAVKAANKIAQSVKNFFGGKPITPASDSKAAEPQARGLPATKGKPSVRTNALMQAQQAEKKALQMRAEGQNQAAVAKFSLSGGNKEKAGKAALASVQKLKAAAILQHRAQKTAGVISLENRAQVKEQHAKAVEQGIRTGTDPFGGSGMDGQKAMAGQLRLEAQDLRTKAAIVARLPDEPPGLPTAKRIAEVASKFGIRLQLRQHPGELPLNVIATLKGLGNVEDPVSVVESNDPETILNYYGGADDLGAMMARIDCGDASGFAYLSGLAGLGDLGLGIGAKAGSKAGNKAAAANAPALAAKQEKAAAAQQQAAYAAATAANPTVIGPDGTPVPAVVGPDGTLVPAAQPGFLARNLTWIGGGVLALGAVGGGLWFWSRRKK